MKGNPTVKLDSADDGINLIKYTAAGFQKYYIAYYHI
jgi:hypothetical protein